MLFACSSVLRDANHSYVSLGSYEVSADQKTSPLALPLLNIEKPPFKILKGGFSLLFY